MQLLILADDFTGAGDAAAPFAARLGTLVVLSAAQSRPLWEGEQTGVDVLAVDLDLRECSDQHAQRETEAAARHLCSQDHAGRVFLKIDSTLRGPVAGLVAGALAGSGKDVAVIAPAFPEQGRVLREGTVMVDGQPGASVLALLGRDGSALIGATSAGSAEEVERAVEDARMRGAQRVIVDADAAECLRSVAGAWRRHPDWLLVGSGGLARRVAERRVPERGLGIGTLSGPILIIAGSPTAVTRGQIDCLVRSAPPGGHAEAGQIGSVAVLEATAAGARLPLPAVPHAVLVLRTPVTRTRDEGESAQAVADTVAEWSRKLVPAAVVLAGGATGRRVLEQLGSAGVRLSGELSPGVPIGRLVGGVWDHVLVVTKAGGFGSPDTLLDVVRSVGVLSTPQP